MSTAQLDVFDDRVETAIGWIDEVAAELESDRRDGYRALRAFLHTLRDRLPAERNAELAAQLPLEVRRVYCEGWRPRRTSLQYRDPAEFVERVRRAADLVGDTEAWFAVEAAATVLRRHVGAGAIDDVVRALPGSLQGLVAC
jgi:uncharacterized protein (DUF2267 family)